MKTYRYDGVDEEGQHWLEYIEVLADGTEIYTEKYVPIRLYGCKEGVCPRSFLRRLTSTVRFWFQRRRSRCGRGDER